MARLPKGLKVTTSRDIKLENDTVIKKGTEGTLVDEESYGGHAVQFNDGEIEGLPGMKDITINNLEPDIASVAVLLEAMADEYDFQNLDEPAKQKYFTLKFAAETIKKLAWRDEHCSYLADKIEAIDEIIMNYKRRT